MGVVHPAPTVMGLTARGDIRVATSPENNSGVYEILLPVPVTLAENGPVTLTEGTPPAGYTFPVHTAVVFWAICTGQFTEILQAGIWGTVNIPSLWTPQVTPQQACTHQ